MKRHKITRLAIALLMGMVVTLPGVSAVRAAPPPNDNFADATVITTLAFDDWVDNTEATREDGEPDGEPLACDYTSPNTVWYKFTPAADGQFMADMVNSSFETFLSVYRATGPGIGDLTRESCASWGGSRIIFSAQAGVTYYFQAGNIPGYSPGMLHFHLQELLLPPNDNWADATVITTLPHSYDVDATLATLESGEPMPTCAWGTISRSVWYSFTPSTTGSVTARPGVPGAPVSAAYTGSSLNGLTEVACRFGGAPMTFRAKAGTTYYIQVADLGHEPGWWNLYVEVTPPPIANFYFWPSEPSIFDLVEFRDTTYDPVDAGIQTWLWNLGDGTTATDRDLSHQYARDADYTVNLTITTTDGRTASASQVVHVRSHDVAIVRLGAPQSASVGQTRHIYVDVRNNRYPENVQMEFYKSTPSGFQWVGTLKMLVPKRPSNRTTQFDFSYTFTADDARMGKVTFKAVANLVDARDALPADNEAISSPTKVGR